MANGVNLQVTDSVATTNATTLATAPSMAMGSLYQTIGNSVAMAAANAVYAQQQGNVAFQSSCSVGVSHLFSDNAA